MPKPSSGQPHDPMSGVVDRLLAQLPGLQGEAPARRSASHQDSSAGNTVHYVDPDLHEDLLGPWARLLLGLALGTMIAWWPYPRNCGVPLLGYFGAIFTIILSGGWAAVSSWRYRASLAHVISLILILYGTMLGAAELLPRTGYAVDQATWECDDSGPSSSVSA